MVVVLLIMGALLSVVAIKLALSSLTRLENAQESLRGAETEIFAESCMQEVFIHLKRDNAYAGGILNLNSGSCTAVIAGVDNNRTVTVTGVLNNHTYILTAEVALSPFAITIWDN